MLKREILFPVRILMEEGSIEGSRYLMEKAPLQATLANYTRPYTVIRGCASIVLDFGLEARASLRILTRSISSPSGMKPGMVYGQGAKIRIRLGESVSECMAEPGEMNTCSDHSPRDFTCDIVSMSDLSFAQSGFRFARIDFTDPEAEIAILAIVSDGVILDLPARYEYAGDDETIRSIFQAAKRTIDLCAAGDYVWDGIKRDRLVWAGDMHAEMLALTTLYGATPMMENSFRFLRDTTPPNEWMNTIMTFTSWWIIGISDYFRFTGKEDIARENIGYIRANVNHFLEIIPEDGNFSITSLVDWHTHEQIDQPAGAHAVLLLMANKIIWLFDALGIPCPEARELQRRLLLQPIEIVESTSVCALKFAATGALNEREIGILKENDAFGISCHLASFSLSAYARYFGRDAAVALMKKYFSGMISRGSTTFWEDFFYAWLEGSGRIDELPKPGEKNLPGDFGINCFTGLRHSLCHGWSAGVIRFMLEAGLLTKTE